MKSTALDAARNEEPTATNPVAALLVNALRDPAVVAALREAVGAPPADERIAIARIADHGAPSDRWVEEQARLGHIAIRGPRGSRFVLSSELDALLVSTLRRRKSRRVVTSSHGSLADDVNASIADLAARRASRGAR